MFYFTTAYVMPQLRLPHLRRRIRRGIINVRALPAAIGPLGDYPRLSRTSTTTYLFLEEIRVICSRIERLASLRSLLALTVLWFVLPRSSFAQIPGYSVSAAPLQVAPATTIRVSWTAPKNHSRYDWIGLYAVGAPHENHITWLNMWYGSSGTLCFTAPQTLGTYEFRAFLERSYTLVAASNPVLVTATPAPEGYAVSASPATIFPCGRITVSWTAPLGHSPNDWIARALPGSPPTSYLESRILNTTETSGAMVFSAPPEGGTFEYRYYYEACTSILLATSSPITVRGRSGCGHSTYDYGVRALPTAVPPSSPITATWVAPEGHDPGDWIGLYLIGAPPEGYLGWTRLQGTSGAWTRTISAVGQYEFRLHQGRTYTEVARSNQVQVTTGPPNPSPIVVQGRVIVKVKPGTPTLPVTNARVTVSQIGTPGWIGEPATTDVLGDYSITLPSSALPGNYTIRATLFFSDFYVVNYRYPLAQNPGQPSDPPPDADRVFLGGGTNSAVDIYVPQPVVLVHGILGSTETWGEAEALLRLDPKLKSRTPRGQQPPGYNWTWPGPIAHRGYIAKSVSYGPWPFHIWNSHVRNAELLRPEIETFRREFGSFIDPTVPIDIVAHSMGGLVTRAYLHEYARDNAVDRVFAFGTPHVGMAYYWHCSEMLGCAFFYQSPGGGCVMLLSPYVPEAFRQMDPLFLNTFNTEVTRTRGARFILIGSDQSRSGCEPEVATLPIPLSWDDGWVSTYSSVVSSLFLGVPSLPILWAHIRPEDHFGLHSNIEPHFILNTVLLEDLEYVR